MSLSMGSWEGTYFDGQSPIRHEVKVTLGPTCLYVYLPDGRGLSWLYGEIRQTQGTYDGETLCLERGGDLPETLIIREGEFIAELKARGFGRRFRSPLKGVRMVGASLAMGVGAIALLAGLYAWGIPWLAVQATPLIPVAWEEWLGSQAIDSLAPKQDRILDAHRLGALNAIVDRLDERAPEHPYDIRVYLLDRDEVNAFALPGGRIVVYSGLLKRTRRAEELAGVLAHELIHVTHRHSTQALLRAASSRILVAALTGSDQAASAMETAVNIGMMHYDRAAETEADRAGMDLMQRAELDSQGMVAMMRMLQTESEQVPEVLQYLSDHPDTGERMQALEDLSRTATYRPRPLLPDVSWASVAGDGSE